MAKRFTDTELWDKDWFMNLKPKLKCLVKLVRDKCDLAGIWNANWVLAKNYIGEKVTEKELLDIDNGQQFVKLPGGKIFCLGFINFQYGTLSEKSPVHRKVISILANHQIDYKQGIEYPINRVKEKEEEKEEEKDKEEEKEKEGVPHLFKDSEFFDKLKFAEGIISGDAGENYLPFDELYYYETVKNWSANGNKKIDWIATSRGFMLRDLRDGRARLKKEFQGKIKSIQNGKQTGGFTNDELFAAAKRAAAGIH